MKALAFSKDRPLQLDGMLRSLALHAAEPVDVTVIWKASSERYRAAYLSLYSDAADAGGFLEEETGFEAQVRFHLADPEHVLLLVDDTIFVRPWSPSECSRMITGHPEAIGFSLRLGGNTARCYPADRDQDVPRKMLVRGLRAWEWPTADGDFGYPLELSSSIYRTDDILDALHGAHFRNPNEMEHQLSQGAVLFRGPPNGALVAHGLQVYRPWLMAYETSVAFSNPCNRVQTQFANRCGGIPADNLLAAWESGWRMRVETYVGFTPNGAHQEVPIYVERRP